jgi:alpha-glucosidase (family GH31 glycosyl hydrolase)
MKRILSRKALILCAGAAFITACNNDDPKPATQTTKETGTFQTTADGKTPKDNKPDDTAGKGDTGKTNKDDDTTAQLPAPPCTSNMPAEGWVTSDGLNYQVSAVDSQIVRVRIGAKSLPEDASWAVLPDARKPIACTPLASSAPGDKPTLKTPALNVAFDSQSGILTVADASGHLLAEDAARPSFKPDGSFLFAQTIPAGSAFFGLGDKSDSADKSGKAYSMWNTDVNNFHPAKDPLYKAIPFFIRANSGTFTGYFLDNTWETTFDFGKADRKVLSLGANGGGIDYYVISGASPKEILKNYAKLTGASPLPALWSFGYQQCRFSYLSAKAATEIADGLRSHSIPADVIWLDIDFQDKNYPFTVGNNYKPFDTFIKNMNDRDLHTVVITDMHIAQDKSGNYPPYTSGSIGDFFVKEANGKADFAGDVWPKGVQSVFPDFTREAARNWWGTLYKQFYVNDGVAGFWNDMNEPAVFNEPSSQRMSMPLDNIHKIEEPGFATRNATHKEVHNVYGMQNARATFDGQLALKPNQRPFVMTRASYAGGQRYGATWTGDNSSTWAHLPIATNMITGLGLGGYAFTAADIGGFHGNPSSQLLTRWLQIGMFYPLSRNHTESGTDQQEPWEKLGSDPNVDDLAIRTKYIKERYALMPYIYTIAEEASRTGIPMMRRMFLEFPNVASAANAVPGVIDLSAETQFMFGQSLLVAPSPIEQGVAIKQKNEIPFGKLVEAEQAVLSGGAVQMTDHTGFTGTGFAAGFGNRGAAIAMSVAGVPSTGQYILQVRYANGQAAANTVTVSVDGTTMGQLKLAPLANWDAWSIATLPVQLTAGNHTITISYGSGDSGNINFDSFAVTAVGAAYPAAAPVTVAADMHSQPYDVLLPPGQWYDYWTGKLLASAGASSTTAWKYNIALPSLKELPVFVRGGSIIPRLPKEKVGDVKSTRDVQKLEQLELAIYPGDQCSGSIYMDAGDGFDYQKGQYYRRNFTCTKTADQLTVSFGDVEGTFVPSRKTVRLHIHGLDKQTAGNVTGLDGAGAPVREADTVFVTLPEPKTSGVLSMSLSARN